MLSKVFLNQVDEYGFEEVVNKILGETNKIIKEPKEKIMDIKDIKAGYLVQFMSGELALAVPNNNDDIMFVLDDGYCISSVQDYNSLYDVDEDPVYNIIAVYSAIKSYQGLFPLNTKNRNLLWSREVNLKCDECPYLKEYRRSL
jgi:hypothetical protein